MESKVGDEVLSHRHIATLKALQPVSVLISYETDEEPCWGFKKDTTYADCYRLYDFWEK